MSHRERFLRTVDRKDLINNPNNRSKPKRDLQVVSSKEFETSTRERILRTVDHKDLIQALSLYLHDVQNLGNIIFGYAGKPFISTWHVGGYYRVAHLPLVSDGKYNFTVDWGDGKSDKLLVLIKLKLLISIKKLAVIYCTIEWC